MDPDFMEMVGQIIRNICTLMLLVAHYPFDDHTPPPIHLIKPFCEDLHAYLSADIHNTAVIHCKAGKGRTGVMIACYLLYAGICASGKAEDALLMFAKLRTKNGKGVTIPSQIRYVKYFERMLSAGGPGKVMECQPPTLFLLKISMYTMPYISSENSCHPVFRISMRNTKIFKSKSNLFKQPGMLEARRPDASDFSPEQPDEPAAALVAQLDRPVPVCGDVRFEFMQKSNLVGKREKMFHFWFNTAFVPPIPLESSSGFYSTHCLSLNKNQIDRAVKDRNHKKYPKNFRIELIFVTEDGVDELFPPMTEQPPLSHSVLRSDISDIIMEGSMGEDLDDSMETYGGSSSNSSSASSTSSTHSSRPSLKQNFN